MKEWLMQLASADVPGACARQFVETGVDTTLHYSDVTWLSWHPRSLAIWMFAQQFAWDDIKETSKLCVTGSLFGEPTGHWDDIKETSKLCITGPLLGESTGDQWIPLTKGQ